MAAVRQVLAPFRLYDYDAVQCPRHYGRIRQELESSGLTIGSEDLLIAAHAMALDAVLVTNNDAHFRRVSGLKVVNWLKWTALPGPGSAGTDSADARFAMSAKVRERQPQFSTVRCKGVVAELAIRIIADDRAPLPAARHHVVQSADQFDAQGSPHVAWLLLSTDVAQGLMTTAGLTPESPQSKPDPADAQA
jgi:hypothetical protein